MNETYSRYDFMTEGSVLDEETGSYWPDPLSLNYFDLKMSSIPMKDHLTDPKITFLWNEAKLYYGIPGYDDIVLTLNGIPHKNFLKPGDDLYFPTEEDIKRSFAKEE